MRPAEDGRRQGSAKRQSVRVTAALLLGLILSAFSGLVSPSFAGPTPGEVAKQVTVLIEGADQGSGILLLRDRSNYTVLTAWHVLKGNGLGEEIAITTPDGVKHLAINGTVRRIGTADLAVLVFQSNDSYSLARVGSIKSVGLGDKIFVGGFPQASSAVPFVEFRVRSGDVEAISERPIPGGYRLLYTAQTLPGMSGGPVVNQSGQVIAVHGQAELAVVGTQQKGIAVKSGTNQGIPISEYLPDLSVAKPIEPSLRGISGDDQERVERERRLLEEKQRIRDEEQRRSQELQLEKDRLERERREREAQERKRLERELLQKQLEDRRRQIEADIQRLDRGVDVSPRNERAVPSDLSNPTIKIKPTRQHCVRGQCL